MGVLAVAPAWRPQAASAAVFTTNAFAAAPIVLDKTECDLDHLVAVVINSANANACTGAPGLTVARAMQSACAETLGVPPSTGGGLLYRHHRGATRCRLHGRRGGQSRGGDQGQVEARSSIAAS